MFGFYPYLSLFCDVELIHPSKRFDMTNSATAQATITIPVGPAGRAMAEPMSSEMLDLMQAHLNLVLQLLLPLLVLHERATHHQRKY